MDGQPHYRPAVILLCALCVVLAGLAASLFLARTDAPLAAGMGSAQAEATIQSPEAEPDYGTGLPVLEYCPEPTDASATFRGEGYAGCDFATLVGDTLAGTSASGTRSLSEVNPTTGEMISVACESTEDADLIPLWSCVTHYDSRLFVYP